MIREFALAVPIVLLAALVDDYDPQVLTLTFADGHEEAVPATSPASCAAAVRALRNGNWQPIGPQPVSAYCTKGDRFLPCSRYIVGYNAPSSCEGSGGSK